MNSLVTFCLSLFFVTNTYAHNFVTISDVSNKSNSLGQGQVDYEYEISIYEVTNKEYCAFLNNVAEIDDRYELYSSLMSEHFLGGIVREKRDGKCIYKVKEGYENKPAVGVTWNSAIRYINWLHYNSENIEKQKSYTAYIPFTEGNAALGAYNTTVLNKIAEAKRLCKKRNKNALYWLPNVDEWLKACYYDGKTWHENWIAQGANCYDSRKGWKYKFPHIKDVGYGVEPSKYGTCDQQGNAAEWVEDELNDWRLAYGGSLIRPKSFAEISVYEGDSPSKSISSFGFRVCRVADSFNRNVSPEIYLFSNSSSITISSKKTDSNKGVYVPCLNARNVGDPLYQFKGQVNYDFYIGKYELSNAEYCRFLNSVAIHADPFTLYNSSMNDGVCGGIYRNEDKKGKIYYSVKQGWENKPVVYISFYDLARYANWLHYGCPNTGKSELGTTEGTKIKGAYNTVDFEDVRNGVKKVYPNFGSRNIGALYWVPNEDEWYKAAYYDPEKIGNRKFHDYPTRSSDAPSHDDANYMIDNSLSVGAPYYVADVTAYEKSASYCGTLQQGGNVWEWLESWQYGNVGIRALRGGSWGYTSYGLHACNTDPGGLDDRSYVFGGRLCCSIDQKGWYPIDTNKLQLLHQYFLSFSTFRFVVLLSLFSISILGTIFLFLRVIIHFIRRKNKYEK